MILLYKNEDGDWKLKINTKESITIAHKGSILADQLNHDLRHSTNVVSEPNYKGVYEHLLKILEHLRDKENFEYQRLIDYIEKIKLREFAHFDTTTIMTKKFVTRIMLIETPIGHGVTHYKLQVFDVQNHFTFVNFGVDKKRAKDTGKAWAKQWHVPFEIENQKVEVFFCDLGESMQQELLKEYNIKDPKEMNWDSMPLYIFEGVNDD